MASIPLTARCASQTVTAHHAPTRLGGPSVRYPKSPSFAKCILLAALLLIAIGQHVLRAQDTESDNPTGPTGDFNGEVTTGGSYDPFTGNVKRRVTDLTVPGSNGAYPLVFARTFNSLFAAVGSDFAYFGDGGNWRHNYQWTLSIGSYNNYNGSATAYTVAYPDGSVITFRPGRASAPASEYSTYWRGPSGTADRLEVQSASNRILHTADGGIVNFGSASHPYNIVDPNGAITKLDYQTNNPNYLKQVTEPGGRWLKFFYVTASYSGRAPNGTAIFHTWTLLHQVQASTGQTVTYSEITSGVQVYNDAGATIPYYVLSDVSYDQESLASGSTGNVHATYGYDQGSLRTATDPHYAGAMVNIRYSGSAVEEQNMGTSERVSHLDIVHGSGTVTTSTETRGDVSSGTGNTSGSGATLTRTFNYGSNNPAIPGDPLTTTNVKPSLLVSVSDFEARTSYNYYYDVSSKDTNGKSFLQTTVDAKGNAVHFQHEPLTGKTTVTTLPDNRTRTASWRAADDTNTGLPYYLYQSTDERGQTTTWHHASNTGLVQQVDYPDGAHEFYNYQPFTTSNGTFYKASLYQNKLGGQITYAYDETNHGGSGFAGLLTSVTRKYLNNAGTAQTQETTAFYYDALDRVTETVDQRGVTAFFTYNSRHQLASLIHGADNTSVVYGYDDNGNRTSVTDELGHTAITGYDEYRRVLYTQVPVNAPMANGQQLASRYRAYEYARRDTSHNVISDALSHTSSAYSTTWLPSGSGAARVYSPNGHVTDQYGGVYINGGYNPVSLTETADTVHAIATYNQIGQIRTATDPQNFVTTYTYDNCNRASTVSDPMGSNGHVTSYAYNPANNQYAGLLASTTAPGADAVGFPTATTQCTSYDNMGRLQASVDAYSHTFDSAFDLAGNLSSQDDGGQTQGANHQTGYVYDQLGRKKKLLYPDGTVEKWTYDASGNVATFTNRATAVCTYQYDTRNRCKRYDWSDGTSPRVFIYDAASRLIEAGNSCSDIKYAYDDSGAVITEDELTAQPTRMVTTYTHDYVGNVDSIKYPSSTTPICYYYDWQNRCRGSYSGGVTNSYYAFAGNWQSLRWLGNGIDTGYAYQNNGRLSYFWHFRGGTDGSHVTNGSLSLQFYGYAPDGQVSWTVRQAGGDQTGNNSAIEYESGDAYYYYPDGRLNAAYRNINVQGGWPGQQSPTADSRVDGNNFLYNYATPAPSTYEGYAYDGAGNRTVGPTGNYPAVDGANRYPSPWSYTDSNGQSNGNTTNAGIGWTYSYDAENHLVSASGPGGASLQFAYDVMDRLVLRVANGVASYFYYAGAQRIEEHDASNQPVYSYVYDAPGSDQILYRTGGGYNTVWYLHDGLGSTTHLVDNGGNVLERYLYSAFGTPTVYDAAGVLRADGSHYDNRFLFKGTGGYEWYPQAQLYYCRARFYLPQHGRWLQPDPIGQQGGLNIYAYCGNDPVNGIDPSGLTTIGDATPKLPYDFTDGDGYTHSGSTDDNHDWNESGSNRPTTNPDGSISIVKPGNSTQLIPQFATFNNSLTGSMLTSRTTGAIGAPGFGESLVPVWGNGRSAINAFQTGHPWQGAFYSAMAVSDVFLVKSLVVAAGRGLVMGGIKAAGNGGCFTAGTMVYTDHGNVPIEEVKVADWVLAQAEGTDEQEWKQVLATDVRTAWHIAVLEVAGEQIETTFEHPFWVEGAGWTMAGQLRVGDKLLNREGAKLEVQNVDIRAGVKTVYNFVVANDHDYFVGLNHVLVHNGLCDEAARGLWELTEEGADEVMHSRKFGKFFRSKSDGLWWSTDKAGHAESAFKVFREGEKGLEWFRDADKYGDFISGKFKGATGKFIPWKMFD